MQKVYLFRKWCQNLYIWPANIRLRFWTGCIWFGWPLAFNTSNLLHRGGPLLSGMRGCGGTVHIWCPLQDLAYYSWQQTSYNWPLRYVCGRRWQGGHNRPEKMDACRVGRVTGSGGHFQSDQHWMFLAHQVLRPTICCLTLRRGKKKEEKDRLLPGWWDKTPTKHNLWPQTRHTSLSPVEGGARPDRCHGGQNDPLVAHTAIPVQTSSWPICDCIEGRYLWLKCILVCQMSCYDLMTDWPAAKYRGTLAKLNTFYA